MVMHAKIQNCDCTACGKPYTFEVMAADRENAFATLREFERVKHDWTKCIDCKASAKAAIQNAGSGI